MATPEPQRKARLDKLAAKAAEALAQLQKAKKQEKARQEREEARKRARERALLFRSADAHRKIVLGGLIIAAGADSMDEATLCGCLLEVLQNIRDRPDAAEQMRQRGMRHLEAREAARLAARTTNKGN